MRWLTILGGLLAFSGEAFALTPLQKACRDGTPAQMISACTKLIAAGSSNKHLIATYYANRGNAHAEGPDCDAAVSDYTSAMQWWPDRNATYDSFYLRRSFSLMRCGKINDAMRDIERVITNHPRDPAGYHNRALIYMEIKDEDKAMRDLNTALSLDPRYANALNARGSLWIERGDLDAAIADYNKAIAINPKYVNALGNRGRAWRMKGDLNKALADAHAALKLMPDSPTQRVFRGDTYRYRGDYDKAFADYDAALRLSPRYVAAMVGRGLTFERMGQFEQAKGEFERALAVPEAAKVSDASPPALETARARLAAIGSGAAQPQIGPAPLMAATANTVPTPAVAPAPARAMQGAERRIALVIGNSSYQRTGELKNPRRDAELLAASLKNIGFQQVALVFDTTREALVSALKEFGEQAEHADWAVIYYAGHGLELSGANYLVPTDAALKSDRDVLFEAVPLDQVMAAVESARKLKLIILDACRDNPFAPEMRRSPQPAVTISQAAAPQRTASRSLGRGLGEVRVSGGTLVAYAAKHGQIALDGENENSPFAVALVQRIATPGVEINKVFRLIRDDVMEATAGRQEPFTYGSLPGREDFFFVNAAPQ